MDGTWRSLALPLVISLLAAACNTGASPASAPPSIVEPSATARPATPSPEPTSTPWPTPEPTADLAALGAAYQVIADDHSALIGPLYDQLNSGDLTYIEASEVYFDLAQAFRATAARVEALEFPASLESDAAELVAALSGLGEVFQASSDDPDLDNDAEFNDLAARVGAAADRLRAALGLPPRATPVPT